MTNTGEDVNDKEDPIPVDEEDKPKKVVPKPTGKTFARRGYETQKGGTK